MSVKARTQRALSSPMSPHLRGRGGADRCCRVSAFIQPSRQWLLFVLAHLFKQGGGATFNNGRLSGRSGPVPAAFSERKSNADMSALFDLQVGPL